MVMVIDAQYKEEMKMVGIEVMKNKSLSLRRPLFLVELSTPVQCRAVLTKKRILSTLKDEKSMYQRCKVSRSIKYEEIVEAVVESNTWC